jgi:hypothetical protein
VDGTAVNQNNFIRGITGKIVLSNVTVQLSLNNVESFLLAENGLTVSIDSCVFTSMKTWIVDHQGALSGVNVSILNSSFSGCTVSFFSFLLFFVCVFGVMVRNI